jgi:hypothetical protein
MNMINNPAVSWGFKDVISLQALISIGLTEKENYCNLARLNRNNITSNNKDEVTAIRCFCSLTHPHGLCSV